MAHSLGVVGGVWSQVGKTLGRAAELVAEWQRDGQRLANGLAPSVERGAAAVAVEAVGGGGTTPHPGNTFRRSSFLFPL